MVKYDDIINLPHYVSKNRTPMSMENRAAQFAPFAALSGHEEAIAETARHTSQKQELSAEEMRILSQRLSYAIETGVKIMITYFKQDNLKRGGSYRNVCGKVKKINEIEGTIIMSDRRSIPLDCVLSIESDAFNDFEC